MYIQNKGIIEMLTYVTRYDQIKTIILCLLFFTIGYLMAEYHFPDALLSFKGGISFILGIAMVTFVSISCILLHIPYKIFIIYPIIFFGAVCYAILLYKHGFTAFRRLLVSECIAVGVIIVISFGFLPKIVGNDTTYFNEYLGYWIAKEGGLTSGLAKPFGQTGLSLASLYAIFALWEIHNVYLVVDLLRISFVILAWSFFYFKFSKKGLSILLIIILVSSTPYAIISSWIISNAYWMFLFFTLVLLAEKIYSGKVNKPDFLLFLLLYALIFARVESIIYILYTCVVFSAMDRSRYARLLILITPSLIIFYVYQLLYAGGTNFDVFFYNYVNIGIVVFAILISLIAICLSSKKPFAFLFDNILVTIIIVFTTGIISLVFIIREKFIYTIKIFVTNMFYLGNTGSWGLTPICFGVGFLGVIYKLIKKQNYDLFDDCLDALWIGGGVITAVTCAFRELPIRVSVADSGNRMLMQFVPLVFMSVVNKIEILLNSNPRRFSM